MDIQIYERMYKKLIKIIPEELILNKAESGKSKSGAYMDLNYDYLYSDKEDSHIIAISHYYKQNGDMCADPDMELRVNTKYKFVEALTIQDYFGYRKVYEDNFRLVNMKAKRDLNKFLNTWLTNLIRQKHKINEDN